MVSPKTCGTIYVTKSTTGGYTPGNDGRQGHRRKIARAPEEVIRRKVMDGLVSQEVFQAVQHILNSRATREQAVRTKNAPKYLFNGFLYCGVCDSAMYSHTNQKDRHYYCKLNSTRARKLNPGSVCPTPYIRAAVIEPKIEELLSVRLQHDGFLGGIAEAYLEHSLLRGLGVGVFVSGYEIRALAMRNLAGLDCNTDNRSRTVASVTIPKPSEIRLPINW